MNNRLRILVADDSAVYRRIFSLAARQAAGDAEIVLAENGGQVLELLAERPVDICLLDVCMPVMDGLETLRHIREKYARMPVILVSGSSPDSVRLTLQALGLGAVDFIPKPQGADFDHNLESIRRHLEQLFAGVRPDTPTVAEKRAPAPAVRSSTPWVPDVVLIAASTGGPAALDKVIPRLHGDLPRPVLVVQHMPSGFTAMLAQTLNSKSALPVTEAREGDEAVPGHVLIAPGGYHMTVRPGNRRPVIHLTRSEPVCGVRPSADVLFASAAESYAGRKVLTVVLTGMGRDGTDGVARLKRSADCRCLIQSRETCVVFGMPGSVQEAGLCDEVYGIDAVAARIEQLVQPGD